MLVKHGRPAMPKQRRHLRIRDAVSKGVGCEAVPIAVRDAMLDACLDAETPESATDCLRNQGAVERRHRPKFRRRLLELRPYHQEKQKSLEKSRLFAVPKRGLEP